MRDHQVLQDPLFCAAGSTPVGSKNCSVDTPKILLQFTVTDHSLSQSRHNFLKGSVVGPAIKISRGGVAALMREGQGRTPACILDCAGWACWRRAGCFLGGRGGRWTSLRFLKHCALLANDSAEGFFSLQLWREHSVAWVPGTLPPAGALQLRIVGSSRGSQ